MTPNATVEAAVARLASIAEDDYGMGAADPADLRLLIADWRKRGETIAQLKKQPSIAKTTGEIVPPASWSGPK